MQAFPLLRKKKCHSGLFPFALIVFFSLQAFGSNGYFSPGYGTEYKAMAGAGTALYLNSLAPAINPAAVSFLDRRLDVEFAVLSPSRKYNVIAKPDPPATGPPGPGLFALGPGMVQSKEQYFVIPSMGASAQLPGGHALAFSVYANDGITTEYNTDTYSGQPPTGLDFSQIFLSGTYGRELFPHHSVGISLILASQRLRIRGLQPFKQFSANPEDVTNNGYSNTLGYGARIGYLGRIFPALTIGASFQTKMAMQPFDEYAGLLAGSGDFDIPATWNAGIAFRPLPALTLAADVQQIFYSAVPALANPMLPNLTQQKLGDTDGAGFCWKDMTVYKIGARFNILQGLTLGAGYSYGKQPVPESAVLFNLLLPAVAEQHLAFGISKILLPGLGIHFAFLKTFGNTISGDNPFRLLWTGALELSESQWEAQLGLSFAL
ncbi:MAG: outer membrane protein transport protein [Calditrichia bacterium]